MHKRLRSRSLLPGLFPVGIGLRTPPDDNAGTEGGGSGNEDTAETGTNDQETGAGSDPGTDDGADEGAKQPDIDGEFDADRAKRAIAAARGAETKAKQRAKTAEETAKAAESKSQATLDAVAVALGLKPDPKADPAQLAKAAANERDQAQQAARTASVELAVYRAAGKAKADPDALLDSRAFIGAVNDLDPTDTDFANKVAEAITEAVEANPKLAATQTSTEGGQGPARQQGADHSGSGGSKKQRPQGILQALNSRIKLLAT